jgi:hypothetical protein
VVSKFTRRVSCLGLVFLGEYEYPGRKGLYFSSFAKIFLGDLLFFSSSFSAAISPSSLPTKAATSQSSSIGVVGRVRSSIASALVRSATVTGSSSFHSGGGLLPQLGRLQ